MVSSAICFHVNIPIAHLYRSASYDSPLETQLLFGTEFLVSEIDGDWAYGQAVSPAGPIGFPGYQGFVALASLMKGAAQSTHEITALCAPVFKAGDIKSPVTAMWPMTVRFRGAPQGDFIAAPQGYIHMRHARPLTEPPASLDFVAIAEQFMGRPYIWGGVSSDGLDCSGLVQTALRAAGHDAPRDSGPQSSMGIAVAEGAPLRRGDLIFWQGHVGIMQNSYKLLHANAFHMSVASEPLAEAQKRIDQMYGEVTARRRLPEYLN